MGLWRKTNSRRTGSGISTSRARPAVECLETREVPYAITGNAWPRPEMITIGIVPDGTDLGGSPSNLIGTLNARFGLQSYWQNQLLKAAQVWAQQTNLNFVLIPDSGAPIGSGEYQQGNPTIADIRIGGYNFGTPALGRAYLPPPANNFSIAGDIQFNTAQTWVIGTTGGYDLFTVAVHEFGHALGLNHSTDYFSNLYANYVGQRVSLGTDDVAGIRAVYSAGQARASDSFDAVRSNSAFTTATNINSLINPVSKVAVIGGRDITTPTDVDTYVFTAPLGTSNRMTVSLQSSGQSLLSPNVTVYDGLQRVIGQASGAGQYGTTLNVTVPNIVARRKYYVKVSSAEATALGTGKYTLVVNFGTGPTPVIASLATPVANGSPLRSSGAQPEEPDHDHDHDSPEARRVRPTPTVTTPVLPNRNLITILTSPSRLTSANIAFAGNPSTNVLRTLSTEGAVTRLLRFEREDMAEALPLLPLRADPGLVPPTDVVVEEESIPAPRVEPDSASELEAVLRDYCFQEPDLLETAVDSDREPQDCVPLICEFGPAWDGLALAFGLTLALSGARHRSSQNQDRHSPHRQQIVY